MSEVQEIEELVAGVAAGAGPKVVGIGRFGSGVVIGDGQILTNAHVVRGEQVQVTFADGRAESGTVTGLDAEGDLAVISADTGGVEPVEWAGDEPAIGAAVVALANPGGRGLRATLGFVSSSEQSFRGPRGRRITGVEHTAPLPRGSGGGPLVDLEGRLLGLNTIRLDGGLILAVPADQRFAERAQRL